MTETPVRPSLFDQIGGEPVIAQLVEVFYQQMDILPAAATIRAMHASDLSSIREVLRNYLGEWLGGPKIYSAAHGHPRLRMRHTPFKIGDAERDAWLQCMTNALEQTVTDAKIRQEIYGGLSKLADWMRNQQPQP